MQLSKFLLLLAVLLAPLVSMPSGAFCRLAHSTTGSRADPSLLLPTAPGMLARADEDGDVDTEDTIVEAEEALVG